VCEACRYAIESRMTQGSGAGRFVRAAGAGLAAAILGALLYYGISALTGYEFGLIAIVVGFAVGAAVRWGSNGRGGWAYQGLAMFLTYLAIVGTYIPPIITELRNMSKDRTEAAASATPGAEPGGTAVPASAQAAAAQDDPAANESASMLLAIVILLVLACAAPFLAGFENIIGLIIIGIGLYEAWKINRRSELTITGPHTLAQPPAPTIAV
jgi:hypothetical protein